MVSRVRCAGCGADNPPASTRCTACGRALSAPSAQTTETHAAPAPNAVGGTEEADADQLQIAGYRVVRVVGRGGMGVVYEAIEEDLGRHVALKVLPGNVSLSLKEIERFHREAAIGGRLVHPGIVKVFRVGRSHGNHFFAMELVDGESLQQFLERKRNEAKGRDSVSKVVTRPYIEQVVGWTLAAAEALQAAHAADIVHRDVKPANILISSSGRVVLTDFGLAREEAAQALTVTGEFMGTPAYMSPEQVLASRVKVDHRTDVYSLGATLYECLTLRTPFLGDSIAEILQQITFKEAPHPRRLSVRVPRDAATVVLRAIEKDPDRRFPTMAEFAEDLRRFLRSEPVLAKPVGPVRRIGRAVRRHPRAAAAVLAAILAPALVLAATYGWLRTGRYIGATAGRDEDAEITVMQGRLGWSAFGFPRTILPTGLAVEDVRAEVRGSVRNGVPVRGDDPVETLLPMLSPPARARVLLLLGRPDEARQVLREGLMRKEFETTLHETIRLVDLLGDDSLMFDALKEDGNEELFKAFARHSGETFSLTRAAEGLEGWMQHSLDASSASFLRTLLTSRSRDRFRAGLHAAQFAPRLVELEDLVVDLIDDVTSGKLRIGRREYYEEDELYDETGLLRHVRSGRRARLIESMLTSTSPAVRCAGARSSHWLGAESNRNLLAFFTPRLAPGLTDLGCVTERAWDLADLLAGLHPAVARSLLLTYARKRDVPNREWAVRRLASLGTPAQAGVLREFLSDSNGQVRCRAASALDALLGTDQPVEHVLSICRDDESLPQWDRLQSTWGLLDSSEDEAIHSVQFLLEQAGSSDEWFLENWAPRALGLLAARLTHVREMLQDAARRPEDLVRIFSNLALVWAGERLPVSTLLETAFTPHNRPGILAFPAAELTADLVERLESSRLERVGHAQLSGLLSAALQHRPVRESLDLLGSPSRAVRRSAICAVAYRDGPVELPRHRSEARPAKLDRRTLAEQEIVLRLRHREILDSFAHRCVAVGRRYDEGQTTDAIAEATRAIVSDGETIYSDKAGSEHTVEVSLASWSCPAPTLLLAELEARHGWYGRAREKVWSLLNQDPRWARVLRSYPGLRPLHDDPRFRRMIDEAMQVAANLNLPSVDPDAPWSPEGLKRHGITF